VQNEGQEILADYPSEMGGQFELTRLTELGTIKPRMGTPEARALSPTATVDFLFYNGS